MSNSKLIDYTKLSPNYNKPRNHKIDKITIHHMAGNLTVEQCGEVFAPTSRQASSNYGISSDGRVGMYVEECNRSWCSSSAANDNRAVTIEVANDQIGGDWHVSDKALAKLIDLCVDICQRNGIEKLNFTGDKSGNLTMHKWFTATACPGPYLESKFPYIAQEVNARLGASVCVSPDDSGDMTDAEMFAYFKAQGLNDYGAAGLMGNLYAESGLAANNLQNTGNTKLGMTDAEYTFAVDSGSYDNFVKDGYGYGLAQWTYYSRKQALLEFMTAAGVSISHKKKQCEFIIKELAGYSPVLQTLKKATSVLEASNAVLTEYERPANQSESVQSKRAGFGQTYYDKYAANAGSGMTDTVCPFKVKVSISDLNIRKGAGTDFARTGAYTGIGVFTITEVKPGVGSSLGWGKLKSGAGWISLDYCTKV